MPSAGCGVRSKQQHRIHDRTTRALLVLGLGVLLALTAGCSKGKQPPPRAVPVRAEQAESRNTPLQIKTIGNVEAYTTVAVKSQVNGEIAEVLFTDGQDVKKGDPLFKIDPRPFEAALRQAESALARDRAQAKNAAEEASRYERLAQKGFVSRQEYDRARTSAEALDAVVKADEAAVENARLQLEYTSIKSPIDGKTGAITVQRGNIVKANDNPSLVTINQITPVYVAFTVPEQDLSAIKKYRAAGDLRVEASAPQSEHAPATGSLTFIDNKVNTATGTILLKATFPNNDRMLWPGQFVDVIMTLTLEKNRVVVPAEALQTGQQGPYVYIVNTDGSAEFRPVTPGRTYRNWTIIERGVAAGETVVIDGQLRLVPGAKVEIKPSAAGQPEGNSKSQKPNPKQAPHSKSQ